MKKIAALFILLALGFASCDMFFTPSDPQDRYEADKDYEGNSLHEKLSNEPSGY